MMQNNTLTITQTPARKLERVRERVRVVTRAVQVTEGRLLDFDTADDIMSALHRGKPNTAVTSRKVEGCFSRPRKVRF